MNGQTSEESKNRGGKRKYGKLIVLGDAVL
jgi:hypothetical protein